MGAKIVLTNAKNRLAVAEISEQKYVVFEYIGTEHFTVGEEIVGLRPYPGHGIYERLPSGRRASVHVLSESMTYARANFIVAPWQSIELEIYDGYEALEDDEFFASEPSF